MSFSAAPPAKIINGAGQIGPIGSAGAAAAIESGAAFESVFQAAASAPEDEDEPDSREKEPGAEAVPPGDSVQNAALEATPVRVVVNADFPSTPIAPPPAGAVDGAQSAAIEAEIHERAGVRGIVASLQADAAIGSPLQALATENTVEDQALPAQPRPLFYQQTEDTSAARRSSPSTDLGISGGVIGDFSDRGFDAARASPRPAPFSADEARLFTDARSVETLPAATVAANAPPGAETSIDTGVALPGAAGTKEASPPAITVVASRQTADGSIELRLDPPELGSVSIDIVTDETGAVTAVVNADRAETLDLLRRHIDIFKGELARNGFGEVDMTFGDGRQSSDEPPPRARAQQHWANQTSAAFDDYAAFALGEGFDVIA